MVDRAGGRPAGAAREGTASPCAAPWERGSAGGAGPAATAGRPGRAVGAWPVRRVRVTSAYPRATARTSVGGQRRDSVVPPCGMTARSRRRPPGCRRRLRRGGAGWTRPPRGRVPSRAVRSSSMVTTLADTAGRAARSAAVSSQKVTAPRSRPGRQAHRAARVPSNNRPHRTCPVAPLGVQGRETAPPLPPWHVQGLQGPVKGAGREPGRDSGPTVRQLSRATCLRTGGVPESGARQRGARSKRTRSTKKPHRVAEEHTHEALHLYPIFPTGRE